MKKEGGCEWYQSMGHIFLYISANLLLFLKGPWPFKSQKTHFSGLTTQYAPRLNLGPSAAKKHYSGWVIAWIFLDCGRNLFRWRIICMLLMVGSRCSTVLVRFSSSAVLSAANRSSACANSSSDLNASSLSDL
jgi:hypothetical protein